MAIVKHIKQISKEFLFLSEELLKLFADPDRALLFIVLRRLRLRSVLLNSILSSAILFFLLPAFIFFAVPVWTLRAVKLFSVSEKILLLFLSVDEMEEQIGDLAEEKIKVSQLHGSTYTRVWLIWHTIWLIIGAAKRKLPGYSLLAGITAALKKD